MFRSTVLFSVLIVALLSLTIVTNHVVLATSNNTRVANQTTSTRNQTAEALPPPPTGRYFLPIISTIARGYFGLGDWESVVHVTSNADFLTCIWARNVEISQGGVQILT